MWRRRHHSDGGGGTGWAVRGGRATIWRPATAIRRMPSWLGPKRWPTDLDVPYPEASPLLPSGFSRRIAIAVDALRSILTRVDEGSAGAAAALGEPLEDLREAIAGRRLARGEHHAGGASPEGTAGDGGPAGHLAGILCGTIRTTAQPPHSRRHRPGMRRKVRGSTGPVASCGVVTAMRA